MEVVKIELDCNDAVEELTCVLKRSLPPNERVPDHFVTLMKQALQMAFNEGRQFQQKFKILWYNTEEKVD
jgi:hypothetical protein